MSWLYSRALVEGYSEVSFLGGEPCVPSKSTHTAEEFFAIDRTTEPSTRSQFGTTSKPLTASFGEAVLTSFLADSRVRTSQQRAEGKESAASDQGCGVRWRGLSVKYDLDSFSWRTHHCLFPEVLEWSSVTLPRWGMMRDGELWERITSGLPTKGIESGLWPTPTVCGNNNRKGASKTSGDGLATAVRKFPYPTPVCHDAKTMGPSEQRRSSPRLAVIIQNADGGTLNPDWVEWLMGWPIGHTGLEPLETDRFQQWLLRHGEF